MLQSPKDILSFYRLNLSVLLLIAVIAVISYVNGLNGQFLSADDNSAIVRNQELRDFGRAVSTLNLFTIHASALINIFGLSPVPFHTVVFLFHVLNSYLVLFLVYILFGKRPALYSSLLFSVLPSGSEAVFWISGTSYIFQAFFSLLCINTFFIFRVLRDRRFLIASALIFTVSLIILQTPWMLTVPFIIILVDLFSYGERSVSLVRRIRQSWYYGIYLVLSLLYWFVWLKYLYSGRVVGLVTDYYADSNPPTSLLARLPYTIYKTTELYVVPLRLSFFHEEVLSKAVYALMVVVTVVVLLLTVYLVHKRSRYAGLVLAIFAAILPTFSPVQVAWFVAERYLYLGGVFFVMILSLVLIGSDAKFKMKNFASITLGIILILYSVRVIIRANDFKSSKALWTVTQKTAPTSYRVYNNLGDVYSNEQNWKLAIASFQMAIKIAPNYADAIHNLGYTYMLAGDFDNAKKYLLESYQKNPKLYQALEKLGQIEYRQGNIQKAKEYFDGVRRINPAIQGLPNL